MSNPRPTIFIKGRRGRRLALSWRASVSSSSPVYAPPIARIARASSEPDRCFRLFHVARIPVRFHWSTLLMLAGLIAASGILGAGLAVLAFAVCTVTVAHELGHAYLARRLGYEVLDIRVFPVFGNCRYDRPYSEYEDAIIAWGGVAAQFLLLLPAAATLALVGNTSYGLINVLLIGLSYFNAVVMACNLAPARGMDGAKAWRLPFMVIKAKWTMRQLRRSKIIL
jgi:Zn-dependent protease